MAGELATSQRAARAFASRSGAQEFRARRAPPLYRDDSRADRHRRDLDRRRTAASARSTGRRCVCWVSTPPIVGRRADQVFGRDDLQPLAALLRSVNSASGSRPRRKSRWRASGREVHLAAAATALHGERRARRHRPGVRRRDAARCATQRVAAWRDVARRLAHEIKNPLTPIQLSRRAACAAISARAAAGAGAGRRMHVDDRRRSRIARRRWSTSSRSSRACRRRAPCPRI